MGYPKTGNEVFVSFSLSNTMLSGIGKGTITREQVSADYLKDLFKKYGVIISAKPEQRKLLEKVNQTYDLKLDIPEQLKIVQQQMYDKAKKNLDEHIYEAHSLEEAKALQEQNGGYIKTMWCGDLECELAMKEKAGMSSRCIPFAQEKLGQTCACCGKPASKMVYWGVAY